MIDWTQKPLFTRIILWLLLTLLVAVFALVWFPVNKMTGLVGIILRSAIEAGLLVSVVLWLIGVVRGIATLFEEKHQK